MLRTDLPNTLPFNSAYGAVVTAMDTSNVDTVMIGGKVLKRGDKLVGVDLAALGRQAAASRDYLVDKLGWPRSVIGQTFIGALIASLRVKRSNLPHGRMRGGDCLVASLLAMDA